MGVVVESQAVGDRMNYFALWLVFSLFAIGEGLMDPRTRMNRPHVETYWESWEEGKEDFASNLIDVPVSPIGSPYGVNVINIAFALPNATRDDYTCRSDPTCITAGYYGNKTLLHQAVKRIHEHGGLVKLAIGGDAYGNPGEGLLLTDVDNFVWRISQVVNEYHLDGVDLTQVRDCGSWSDCGLVDIQLAIIEQLRRELPSKILSYTFPWGANSLLHKPVISRGHQYLDYITGFRGSAYLMEEIKQLGVPTSKIVWGIQIARDCYMSKVMEAAHFVKSEFYGGVMTWSINSDTNHRGEGEPGNCTEFQTGRPDGSYVEILSLLLNSGM